MNLLTTLYNESSKLLFSKVINSYLFNFDIRIDIQFQSLNSTNLDLLQLVVQNNRVAANWSKEGSHLVLLVQPSNQTVVSDMEFTQRVGIFTTFDFLVLFFQP